MTRCCRESLNCSDVLLSILDGGKSICTNCVGKISRYDDPELKNKFLYKMAWEKWNSLQYTVLFEEMSELQKDVCKRLRLEYYIKSPRDEAHRIELEQRMKENVSNICSEIADVQIMLDQMKVRFGEEEVEKVRKEKLERLAGLLK